MTDIDAGVANPGKAAKGFSALSLAAGFSAFFSAAACCVLPLLLGGVGIGASTFAVLVPYHWPLTIAALIAVAAAWGVFAWQARTRGARRSTFIMLIVASLLTLISTFWSVIETPLVEVLS